ncbi:hypothetical protein LIER_30288 [Lithospermum erythrorhizon]|uniref:Uncharacterized protein n=1 Tax=Lithospermum erythrorhizon TaxID=34254 RepID=A0AAV3RM58_LITER
MKFPNCPRVSQPPIVPSKGTHVIGEADPQPSPFQGPIQKPSINQWKETASYFVPSNHPVSGMSDASFWGSHPYPSSPS